MLGYARRFFSEAPKYIVGVTPSAFRKAAIKALGVL
jgi:hypothetical protein